MSAPLSRSTALWLFLSIVVVGLVYPLLHYRELPDTLATHFGMDGRADGWSSRESFLVVWEISMLLLAALFLGITLLLSKVPASLINIPHRRYWLAPERREGTVRALASWILWMANATAIFMLIVVFSLVQVNLGHQETLGPLFQWGLIAYLALTVCWTAALVLRFLKRREAIEESHGSPGSSGTS